MRLGKGATLQGLSKVYVKYIEARKSTCLNVLQPCVLLACNMLHLRTDSVDALVHL